MLWTDWAEIFSVSSHWARLEMIAFLAPYTHGKRSSKSKTFCQRFCYG